MANLENLQFTEKEQYWINNLLLGEELLNDSKTKFDTWLTNGYLDYMDLLIKYGNLRIPKDEEEYQKLARVVKINRKLDKKLLNAGKYHFAIFNGVYVIQKVVFAKAEHCEAILNKQLNDNENLKEEELLLSSFKQMCFEDGSKWCVFLVKSDFTKRFVGYQSSYWDYPYVYDDECGE